MCPHTLKKGFKPFVESYNTKQSCKNSYAIPKGPPKKRCGEQAKAEINVF
jgi:hypothetical protein